jgi:glutathione peroxidase
MTTTRDTTAFDFTATLNDGTERSLDRYRGRALLVVNVASRCGYTPQYAGLERLYRTYRDRGLEILAFPCNQFGRQEPGTDAEIGAFCQTTYDVTFPMFRKVDVNGPHAHPLFVYLKSQKRGVLGSEAIKWNFTKFLVDREGRVMQRFAPTDTPDAIEPAIVRVLAAGAQDPPDAHGNRSL